MGKSKKTKNETDENNYENEETDTVQTSEEDTVDDDCLVCSGSVKVFIDFFNFLTFNT